MSEAAPSDRELDGYRAGADRFIAELDEEYYLHYAGLKPDFELRPIYERHSELTDLENVKKLGRAVRGRENLELLRFGCEGFLGELTREHAEKIAEREASLEIRHEGEPLGYRMLPPTIANAADRDVRAELERRRNALTEEHLNPLHLDAAAATPAPRVHRLPTPPAMETTATAPDRNRSVPSRMAFAGAPARRSV